MAPSRTRPRGQTLVLAAVILAAAFGLLLGTARPAAATTYVPGGTIGSDVVLGPTGTPVADSTYIILNNVTIAPTANVTVQPGTTILFNPSVHLYVQGTLWAVGNATSPIEVHANGTNSASPWGGIEFQSTGQGRISWANISQATEAVVLRGSSPVLTDNTISNVTTGIRTTGSSSLQIRNNVVDHSLFAIQLTGSSGLVQANRINDTAFGITAVNLGAVTLANNTLTNVTLKVGLPLPSIGFSVDGLTSAVLSGNVIRGVAGVPGSTPILPGWPGSTGGPAIGVLVNATGFVTIRDNTVDGVVGGAGGIGAGNLGTGGAGGGGGLAAGVIVVTSQSLDLQGNLVANVTGGAAGDGGVGSVGGAGGIGGGAAGIDVYYVTSSPAWSGNTVRGITGGVGGNGGAGFTYGNGSRAGDAYGLLLAGNPDAQSADGRFDSIRGGLGGTSNPLGSSGQFGGGGGFGYGIAVLGADGTTTLHANAISNIVGGDGGAGYRAGGAGGNSTGAIVVGDGAPFNATSSSFNTVGMVRGGFGGTGHNVGGMGGTAIGLAFAHVTPSSATDSVSQVLGGNGGNASFGNPAGQGGEAGGMAAFLVPSSSWIASSIQTVQRGAFGAGTTPAASFGSGFYFLGNSTVTARARVTNATVSGTSDDDLFADNGTAITTVNTPLGWSKIHVEPEGFLTIRNYLSVTVRYPNNVTLFPGATVRVSDDGTMVYNAVSPAGQVNNILVTDRVYPGNNTPVENITNVSVTATGTGFASSPRSVNMSVSRTEVFVANDTIPPSSSALALPPYETARSFSVEYVVSDGNGVGIENVTLWYRGPAMDWTVWATQAGAGSGTFGFTAPSDGAYAFLTIATDRAGNAEPFPAANDTWTFVDTVAPTSHVLPLPTYERSLSFAVGWAPDAGVTDIANYTVEYNTGGGWTAWLSGTTALYGTFTAPGQGTVAFRVIATDFAGNVEPISANGGQTIVDTIAPQVTSTAPTGNVSGGTVTITVTFSEPMNTSYVEAAFSVSPAANGTFAWSGGGTILRYQITASLAPGTTYTVTVGSGARDLAGNPMGADVLFSFATPAPPPTAFSIVDYWWLLLIVAAIVAGLLAFVLLRRRGAAEPAANAEAAKPPVPAAASSQAAIDDVFLLYRRDGVLIKHETRRLRPDIDTDILSGMLTAVQQFVKDSFRGEEDEELNEMTVGQMHILIGRGKYLIVAATITGGDVASMTKEIQAAIQDMEDHHWDQLDEWDGDMELGKALAPYLKKLIRGEYA